MGRALVSFLSDYGHEDEFVGVCHGVIARRCPEARIIDITHEIPRGDIRLGALVLADALPYMPSGVHLAVVDPGVGALDGRAAVAVRAAEHGRILVGPDNGLLMIAAEPLGGALAAGELVVYEDSNRMAAIAVNLGSAAELLGIATDQQLRVLAAGAAEGAAA